MIISGQLTTNDFFILDEFENVLDDSKIKIKIGLKASEYLPDYPDLMRECKFYNDGFGDWYLFGGYMMHYALINASSFCDAYDIYLDEFAGQCEIGEDTTEAEIEYGTFTSSGKWFSECTTHNVLSLPINDYEFLIDICENDGVSS